MSNSLDSIRPQVSRVGLGVALSRLGSLPQQPAGNKDGCKTAIPIHRFKSIRSTTITVHNYLTIVIFAADYTN